jgi:glucosamine--fructose-6-phosphate aminotransferase (isomerizing)
MRMDTRGQYTREEIYAQPDAWKDAITILKERKKEIQDFSKRHHNPNIIFTGCGSTYYLSCAAAALFQEVTGLVGRGMPASELWLSPKTCYHSPNATILIAVSRSGETSETIRACEQYRSKYGDGIITLVCDPQSTLAQMGSVNLSFPFAMEKSVAQTRAFSTLYLGGVFISLIWGQQSDKLEMLTALPECGQRIMNKYAALAANYGQNLGFERLYFLGSGGRYGLACELNLKMKEMSLTHSEAFHFLEFRHGPKAMVNQNTLVVGLVSEANAWHEIAVLEDMRKLGAEIVSIGETNADVAFNSGLEEVMRNILYLPFGQILAYERSMSKGFDPDHPKHLDQVVRL